MISRSCSSTTRVSYGPPFGGACRAPRRPTSRIPGTADSDERSVHPRERAEERPVEPREVEEAAVAALPDEEDRGEATEGTVTAGNAPGITDGAAATVVMSGDRAKALGLKPLARFVSFATAGCPPEEMGVGPVFAIPKALKLAGLKLADIDVIELNEAFAAQSLAVMQDLSLDPAKVNPMGGAIALGHPIGCTGARILTTLVYELRARGGRWGLATLCVSGGLGVALEIETV